jgi:hypothetical protein
MYPRLREREKIGTMREDVLSVLPFSFFQIDQSRVPDAVQRVFAVHRRAGTHRGRWLNC